jgi:hypothetical protein
VAVDAVNINAATAVDAMAKIRACYLNLIPGTVKPACRKTSRWVENLQRYQIGLHLIERLHQDKLPRLSGIDCRQSCSSK